MSNGILAPDGPAYKAMVVTSDQNLTIEGIGYLKGFAQSNLPIIVTGGTPGYYPSSNSSEREATESAISDFLSTANVYQVGEGEVASQLTSLGFKPKVGVQTNGTWYTTWREDAESGTDYAFVFNNLGPSDGEITVTSTKTPYIFNAWTGSRTPLLDYTASDNETIIPLSLGGNQTTIIAFIDEILDDVNVPPYHITKMPSNVLGYTSNSSSITLHVAASSSSSSSSSTAGTVSLSTGAETPLPLFNVPSAFELGNWTLTAEHWEAPSDLYDAAIPAVKRNTTHELDTLIAWNDIPELVNASGLGYYTTSFTWPPPSSSPSPSDLGAYLRLTPAKNALLITVNSQSLPPIDVTNPLVDITPYLLPNTTNTLLITTPTTMWNYIRSIISELRNGGTAPSFTGGAYSSFPNSTVNGLRGEVEVVPFVGVVV